MSPLDLTTAVLYRDELILVIDKPAGLPVHAGPSGGPNLELYLRQLRFGLPHDPALAHRLDRDTSGCLVLGRQPKALKRLGRLFSAGQVEKTYWAVVGGAPPAETGTVDLALSKVSEAKKGWRIVADPAGKPAVTDYRLLGRSDGLSWLELRPRSGRTHQIRVHCAALGCPVLGDPVYGPAAATRAGLPPLHLHARALGLPALRQGKPAVAVVAPPPPHMLAALQACGYGA